MSMLSIQSHFYISVDVDYPFGRIFLNTDSSFMLHNYSVRLYRPRQLLIHPGDREDSRNKTRWMR